MTVRVELPYRRGAYCARLRGPDTKYGLVRDFEKGRTVKRDGGRLVFDLEPGWYELCERWTPDKSGRRLVAVDTMTMLPLSDSERGLIALISAGPNPGEPGAYGGDYCECGEPVTRFDPEGFPKCETHYTEPVTVPDHLPDTA